MEDTTKIIMLILCIIFFIIGRYILPKTKDAIQDAMTQFQLILNYAESFCAYAREFLECSGSEKMDAVVDKLSIICDQQGIDIDKETLRAISQKAYESMINGEAQAMVELQSVVEDIKTFPAIEDETVE